MMSKKIVTKTEKNIQVNYTEHKASYVGSKIWDEMTMLVILSQNVA